MKLKKCPFCKTKDLGVSPGQRHSKGKVVDFQYVHCNNEECNACGPEKPTEKSAIKAWNSYKKK